MIPINILTLYNLEKHYSHLNDDLMIYLNKLGHDTSIDELQDILVFIEYLKDNSNKNFNIFDGYILGFVIERIGKEFDFLRFGKNKVINIEIKRKSSINKIKNQLEKNAYYLNLLKKDIELYTFISSSKILYQYKNEKLTEVDFNVLTHSLKTQVLESKSNRPFDVDSKFDTDKFIISPINNFDLFYKRKYFLTNEQQQIKKHILKNINNIPKKIIGIKGQPGSGKTLLAYDIALTLYDKAIPTVIVHCGNLSPKHEKINTIQGKIFIISIKDFFIDFNYYSHKFEVIIIDEAQRLRKNQLDLIEKRQKYLTSYFILSFFPYQRLSRDEFYNGIDNIEDKETYNIYSLKGKIRSNYNITHFIKCFFNKSMYLRSNNLVHNLKNNVSLDFTISRSESLSIISNLLNDNWNFLVTNSSNKSQNDLGYNSFDIIGQEFKNVVIILDKNVIIKNNDLCFDNDFSQLSQLIYQNMTRARDNLHIIIEDNPSLFKYISEIIDFYS